jgi:hypothetical protein
MDWPRGASLIDWRKVTIAMAARFVRQGKVHVSRIGLALEARSKQGVTHGSTAILREKRLRSKPSKSSP